MADSFNEKTTHPEIIDHETKTNHGIETFTDENGIAGFEADEATMPRGYYKSSFFVGSMAGICLGLLAGVAGYAYIAPILAVVNSDIGPVSL
jgi:hypothetical protein